MRSGGFTVKRVSAMSIGLSVALGVMLVGSLLIGPVWIAPFDVLRGLISSGDDVTSIIVQEIRLPRSVLGAMVGASLGASGAALQGLLRNPLADPAVIGVSASAGLGAVVAIAFGLGTSFALGIPLAAMVGALLATGLLYLLATRDASILTLILAGIGISSLATAAMALAMNFAATPFTLQDMVMWLLGSLSNRSMTDIYLAAPFMCLGGALFVGVGQGLDALSLGEDTARSLGIDLRRVQLQVILGTALCVGASVAVCGAVGFVGLVVPHLVRSFVGYSPRLVLLPSALGGAVLLTLADMITRIPLAGTELRLGVVMAFIGSPVFLYIVVKTREAMR